MLKLDSTFPRESIRWRAQSVSNGKALALAYIDARDVMERLDAVCEPSGWQSEHYDCGSGRMACKIGIFQKHGDYGNWVWKSDGSGDTQFEAEKGAFSGAFKRAAVMWGVGRYLYDIIPPWVPCKLNANDKFKEFTEDPWKHVRPGKTLQTLHGPLTMTELGKRLRTMAGEIYDIEDPGSLERYREVEKPVIDQCERDLPNWFFGTAEQKGLEQTFEEKANELRKKA